MLFRFADPKVATRNFVGIVHAQVCNRAALDKYANCRQIPPKMNLFTESKLQSGASQR